MPWTPDDAIHHTHEVKGSDELKRLWSKVANQAKGRGLNDSEAIGEANAAVNHAKHPRFI